MSALERQLMGRRIPPMVPPPSGRPMSGTDRAKSAGRSRFDYSPVQWSQYFTSKRDLKTNNEDSFRVYISGVVDDHQSDSTGGSNTPLVVLLHGGGYSGLTFGPFVREIQELCDCNLIAIDCRGHGSTVTTCEDDLSTETLTNDVFNVITSLYPIDAIPPIILMGHSMGGAIAVHCCATLEELMPRIVGLIVIDVVEGTALDALHSMQSFLRSRPSSFPTLDNAIEWSVRSGQTRNVEAARLSMPGQLKNIKTNATATSELESDSQTQSWPQNTAQESDNKSGFGLNEVISEEGDEDNADEGVTDESSPEFKKPENSGYTWRTDLFRSEPYWSRWFQDLSNLFLDCRANAKLLLLAGVDRLDRALTVGQMQGKFQMQVLPKCGHTVHEDVPDKVAEVVASFLIRNRFTQSKRDFERPFPSC